MPQMPLRNIPLLYKARVHDSTNVPYLAVSLQADRFGDEFGGDVGILRSNCSSFPSALNDVLGGYMKGIMIGLIVATVCSAGSSVLAVGKPKADPSLTKWVIVKTSDYTIELPRGWSLGPATPFGQRTISPAPSKKNIGKFMTAMTAAQPVSSSWTQLYHTALYFISQQNPLLKPTPYHLWRSPQGMTACSWEMKNGKGQIRGLYTVLRNSSMHILALSVHVPNTPSQKALTADFQHLVNTAVLHTAVAGSPTTRK